MDDGTRTGIFTETFTSPFIGWPDVLLASFRQLWKAGIFIALYPLQMTLIDCMTVRAIAPFPNHLESSGIEF